MTLFFDLNKLTSLAKNNPSKIVDILRGYYEAKRAGKMPLYPLRGTSWLLHPERLFYLPEEEDFKTQYLILAAKRDYHLYKEYGSKSLIISYFPDLELDKLKHNPLLTITDKEIKFKYEE